MKSEPLRAVSTVIELKPGHQYLLVLRGHVTMAEADHATRCLKAQGIQCFSLVLGNDVDLDVVEVPPESEVSHD